MAHASQAAPLPISFLSDYGHADEFVGVCHGVIAMRCPLARLIDISHGVPRHDVRAGALMLRAALAYMPVGVHLAVVDPGVGAGDGGAAGRGARRALALRSVTDGRLFVGPDNGLLALACEDRGGVAEAVDIGASPVRLQPLSRTFHGRDIFAPVAAALAAGAPLQELGEPLEVDSLVRLDLPVASVAAGLLRAHVVHADTFGNLVLDATPAQLATLGEPGAELRVIRGTREQPASWVGAYADVAAGELLVYEDARGMVAVAVNRGSAADVLGAAPDDELELRPR